METEETTTIPGYKSDNQKLINYAKKYKLINRAEALKKILKNK